ncbi:hypothetical protein [Paenibacillus sp. 1P07SE]|uniref:hypothetical protein n=1 Tax=Paenibacillus sp. 1P07SE TaxID=3132209 RepID=UPI0039A3FF6E
MTVHMMRNLADDDQPWLRSESLAESTIAHHLAICFTLPRLDTAAVRTVMV